MPRSPDSTLPAERIPTVVLIAPSTELLATCERIARGLDEAPTVKVAEVAAVATVVAERRPFAVIIQEPVFAFDPDEFSSLASTVGAELLLVGTDEVSPALELRLVPRLKAALAWWQARQAVSP